MEFIQVQVMDLEYVLLCKFINSGCDLGGCVLSLQRLKIING